MTAATTPGSLFGTFLSYQERNAEALFGRGDDVARLEKLLTGPDHLVVLSGPSGVGKTSVLRAGLTPALKRRELTVVTLTSYRDLERELVRATSVVGIAPPVPGQDAADYLGGVAREARGGLVLILDNLEEVLVPAAGQGEGAGAAAVAEMALRVVEEAPRTRLLLSVDDAAYARLATVTNVLGGPSSKLGVPATMTLPRLPEAAVADILERTAVQSGTPFESGLAAAVAGDLTRGGRCRGFDLQLAARAIVDLRLASLRRYRRSGGPAVLPALWLADVCGAAGGGLARRALLAAGEGEGVSESDLGVPTRRGRNRGAETLTALQTRGLLVTQMRGRKEVFALAHPALREIVEDFAITDRARATNARRALTRRIATGTRLRVPELVAIHRHLRGTLTGPERAVVRRGLGAAAMRISLGLAVAMLVIAALYADSRRAYSLAFEPADASAAARVVVRLGRPKTSFLDFLPSTPPLGSVIADTGFAAGGLGRDTVARIAGGRVSGTLDATPPGHVPGWLREVLNGLRPVPRGIAKALLGDPDGVAALKLAFSDPAARGEILSALNVIGRGGAGEDEILAGALADVAPEIRRRGVAVAAAIARRQAGEGGSRQAGEGGKPAGQSTHAATLRAALGDRSADVRAAVLQEAATLAPRDAAGIVTLALRDPDPALRRRAEEASEALAAREPAAVVAALADLLQGGDAGARRAALVLFESIAARAPAASAPVLGRVVLNERTPDDARVAALLILRRTGPPSPTLRPALEKAIRPESSPRLRSAALPLYARLVSPAEAEEIARDEMKGPPAARASAAAVWGAVAATRPEEAAKPLKGMLYDPSTEVRVEAARAYGYLKRDGLELVDKALRDPSPEVERAALESAAMLAGAYPVQVADMLGGALKEVRPAVRRSLIETLARLGEGRGAVALPPLSRAVKDSDGATRVAAANGFCALAKKNAAASAPYLRVAARDERDDVRTAAAACLADVAAGDPKGASRIAAELAESPTPAVRAAAADALGTLGPEAAALAFPTLLKLIADADPQVRANAERAFAKGASRLEGKRYAEAERALEGALVQGDAAERKLIVGAAAKAGLWGLLRQAARDGDEAVRLEAVRAAGAGKGVGLDIVRGAVDDRSQTVRAEAMRLLAGGAVGGARDALPTFEAMLHGADPSARTAAVAGIGELPDAGDAGVRLLGEALGQRSEGLRAAAARALGRLAERDPVRAAPYLEKAVRDPSYDVRSAALPGLALAWSQRQDARELGRVLVGSDTDSIRRFVALEALVALAQRQSAPAAERAAARAELDRVGESGPALARLAARIGKSFIDAPPAAMHAFIERLFGG
jgi:HEAT repeat protein